MESFHIPYGLNPVSETFPPWLKYMSGKKPNFCHFLDFCGMKMVRLKCLNVSKLFAIGSWNSKISPSVSTLKYLLPGHVSPPSPPSLFSLLMFSLHSLWKKTLPSVSLVRKSTCPTLTEQNWADVTAGQHGPSNVTPMQSGYGKTLKLLETLFTLVSVSGRTLSL